MTFLFYGAIALVVVSNVAYHLFQKATPADANPLLALVVTYGIALLACLVLLPFFPSAEGWSASLTKINWASIGLGLAVVGLELGFLAAYRAGWPISLAGLVANVLVGMLLLPVGLILLREKVSWINLLGIAVCLIGIVLVNFKPVK
ncbi:MAG: EamA family transporter [Anaerolineales bacterium]|nr:EamA family transporter [Anaerolineales bacterium]